MSATRGRPLGPLLIGLLTGKVMFVVDGPGSKDALYRSRKLSLGYGRDQSERRIVYVDDVGTALWWVDKGS